MSLWLPVGMLFILLAVLVGALLPVRVKVQAAGSLQGLSVKVWVKPPFWPWYLRKSLRIPKVKKRTGKDAGGRDTAPQPHDDAGPKILRRVREGIASIQSAYPGLREGLSLAMEGMTFESVRLVGSAGTGEAADTAILCGTVNMLAGVFLSVAQRKGARFRRKPLIRVHPVFTEVHFSILAEVETSFTLARAFYITGMLVRHLRTAPSGERKQGAIFSRESGILN